MEDLLDIQVAISGRQLDESLVLVGQEAMGWTTINLIYVFVYIKPWDQKRPCRERVRI